MDGGMDLALLRQWRQILSRAELECHVPEIALARILAPTHVDLLGKSQSTSDAMSYARFRPITNRYLNDAYVWANVLRQLGFVGRNVTEIAPGRSLTIALALALLEFDGELVLIDSVKWPSQSWESLRYRYSVLFHQVDIFSRPDLVEDANLLAMNHAIDDLFIGLWAAENNMDYFGPAMDSVEISNAAWANAMANPRKHLSRLTDLASRLCGALPLGALVVIRNYPSRFETYYEQVDRVNFVAELTARLVKVFEARGFQSVGVDLGRVAGHAGSKFPGSFWALLRR